MPTSRKHTLDDSDTDDAYTEAQLPPLKPPTQQVDPEPHIACQVALPTNLKPTSFFKNNPILLDVRHGRFSVGAKDCILETQRWSNVFNNKLHARCLVKSAPGIRINADENWFYKIPGIVVGCQTRGSDNGTYMMPLLQDTLTLLRHFRFGVGGVVIAMSRQYAVFALQQYSVDELKFQNIRTRRPTMPCGLKLEQRGDSTVKTYAELIKMHQGVVSIHKCKSPTHNHVNADVPMHPHSEFVLGYQVCKTCYVNTFVAVPDDFVSVDYISAEVPKHVRRLVFPYLHKQTAMQPILRGMCAASSLQPYQPLTLEQYAFLGHGIQANPLRYICMLHRSSKSLSRVPECLSIINWCFFNRIVKQRRIDSVSTVNQTLLKQGSDTQMQLDYLGWTYTTKPVRLFVDICKDVDVNYIYSNEPTEYHLFYSIEKYVISAETRRSIKNKVYMYGTTICGLRSLRHLHVVVSLVSELYQFKAELEAQAAPQTHFPKRVFIDVDHIELWTAQRARTVYGVAYPYTCVSKKQKRALLKNTWFYIMNAHRIQWRHFTLLANTIGATHVVLCGSLATALEGDSFYTNAVTSPEHPFLEYPHPLLGGVFAYLFDRAGIPVATIDMSLLQLRVKSLKREARPEWHESLTISEEHTSKVKMELQCLHTTRACSGLTTSVHERPETCTAELFRVVDTYIDIFPVPQQGEMCFHAHPAPAFA